MLNSNNNLCKNQDALGAENQASLTSLPLGCKIPVMLEQRPVVSWDFDGVLFRRFPAQTAVLNPFAYRSPLTRKGKPIFWLDRWSAKHSLSRREISELNRHTKRPIRPGIAGVIRRMTECMHVGNTGRPNNRPMIMHTKDRLLDAGLAGLFDHIYFKPEGVESDESKYWALVELRTIGHTNITHYDDNARTVRRLAEEFHDMRFVIVQDLTSGILFSRREMQDYPNVARVAIKESGRIEDIVVPQSFGILPHSNAA